MFCIYRIFLLVLVYLNYNVEKYRTMYFNDKYMYIFVETYKKYIFYIRIINTFITWKNNIVHYVLFDEVNM